MVSENTLWKNNYQFERAIFKGNFILPFLIYLNVPTIFHFFSDLVIHVRSRAKESFVTTGNSANGGKT